MNKKAAFKHRTCYVNFAEHLQNYWNVNFIYHNAPGKWSNDDWKSFFNQIKEFGYNNFQFWIPPTLYESGAIRDNAVNSICDLMKTAKEIGIKFNPLITVNTIGAQWHLACPNDPADRVKIIEFWDFYSKKLAGADIFTIFPGDPGGCNRNGCDHVTYIELCVELSRLIKKNSPDTVVEVGTWGTPFTGWGEDMAEIPNWDGSFAMLMEHERNRKPGDLPHIWRGTPERAGQSMKDLIKYLPEFEKDTMFAINLGFNPDSDPVDGYDGRKWICKVAETNRVTSWDYSLAEGELINYPHWRLPRMRQKRLMEAESVPYFGGISYTMTPKLNMLSMYAGAQLFIEPTKTPEKLSSEFTGLVFGDPAIGPLMESFEIVPGWGHYPRRAYTKNELQVNFKELIKRLEMCKGAKCNLPLFPDAETYRKDLLWHARNFFEMTGEITDTYRDKIRKRYRDIALSIYDVIPMSVDERAEAAANGYSKIGLGLK